MHAGKSVIEKERVEYRFNMVKYTCLLPDLLLKLLGFKVLKAVEDDII
jgi:hypothetical protein